MQFLTLKLVVLTVLGSASSVGAICPGFNAGIGHQQNLGGGVSRYSIAGSCGSDSISVCCRNDGGRLASFEPEEVGLDLTVEEFSEEELSEEAA
ncbi:hypothetical protein FJTKL_03375 [Diaporthe vaccinii]|uniref:Hydrophobin n=1 Tax=Diaporthe vaccinii TaxID=105482 RepID=A0ABR4F2A1_9PEZI